ncbi:hypothetical protein PTSG_04204 [Salpingoeca rosetta]|uniref:Sialidase domain-containing protein n=1 Tax=Salpingoeca rosetta (strain ATCC 50818 / BSB-021) TaxID=946362 RepID=F2U6W4_SALR5|nr:uncharacterized protein PTSG_04204 [Salpingoeca rosetta]EGD83596.1 hypothetical protein PTSG_04204 [Salpingoeca rosetta]|eukprot:XP_004995100.1 hypothetical protein PTSG_04204 [Salpingoeca rosetta]
MMTQQQGVVVMLVSLVVIVLVSGVLSAADTAEGAAVGSGAVRVPEKCQQLMDAYCNSPVENAPCLHALEEHNHPLPLYARFDTNAQHGPKQWRCYSSDALDSRNQSYVKGTGYCTRDEQIRAVIADCEANVTLVDVFTPGEAGYPCIRIPSLVLVGDGSLLAFAECRNWTGDGCEPTGVHAENSNRDICMKRSRDSGHTWSPLKVILRNAAQPTAVFDTVHNQTVLNYIQLQPASNLQVVSFDNGNTWSTPLHLDAFLGGAAPSDVGPGVGLQLKSNVSGHAGRLLFIGHHGAYQFDSVWFSDDGGHMYSLAQTNFTHMDEAQLVELPDGRVLANMRNNHINKCSCRGVAISDDGGTTFGPVSFAPQLISPVCQATILTGNDNKVYFVNPASTSERVNGVLRQSSDGIHWDKQRTVYAGAFAYSCLSLLPNNNATHLGLLFETAMLHGCEGPSCRTVFAAVATSNF